MKKLCERYDASALQQLHKTITGENNELTTKNVFPVTLVQSVFDGLTGTRLDQILALNNCMWLPFNGTREATRLQIGPDMRRKGLIISFRDLDGVVYTQRYLNGNSTADEQWRNDTNWEDVFTGFNDTEFIEQLKKYLTDYVDEKTKTVDSLNSDVIDRPLAARQGKVLREMIESIKTMDIQIVEKLPAVGKNNILYLVLDPDSNEGNNTYIEYVWINAEQRYEVVGSLGNVKVDTALSETSENPVQNKVITEALKRINAELFPLSISVSGGGTFEKRTTQTITVRWLVKEGSNITTPDTVSVNNVGVPPSTISKVFEGVTSNTTYTVKAVKSGTTVQGSTSIVFVNPSYFGAVDAGFTPTENAIKALTKSVKSTKGYTGNTSLVHQKTCYAYPKSFGALTAIKDANNFEYLGSYTRSEITVWDEVYYVYVLTSPVTIENFKQIYS